MDVSPVLELLRQKIGLNPESVGTVSVENIVRQCIETSGADSVEDYVRKVKGSPEELARLIESVVVKETSFFRNTTPFVTLQRYLKQFVLNKNSLRPLRILCLPCATGEEAYSIAMVLFDMNLSPGQFHIFAGDISEQVLRLAKDGRYNGYSFRGGDIGFRRKYFSRQKDDTYLLNKEVRNAVHFEQANILADDFLSGHKPYDIIFCRNLLIYLDDAAKGKAFDALSGHLTEEGVLFVGHAEGAVIHQFGFASLDYPMSFAYARKAFAAVINEALDVNKPAKRKYSAPVAVRHKAAKAAHLHDTGHDTPVKSESEKKAEKLIAARRSLFDADISRARQLAEAGAFGEAAAICEKLLTEGIESAEIYYMLGQAAGSDGENLLAEEYLKKAVYLDSESYDALLYLSVIYERMNSPDKAASFRSRAQRVKTRKEGAVQ